MAIRIVPNPTFTASVPLTVAGQDAPELVDFEFRHKTPAELRQWGAGFQGRDTADVLADVVVRWVRGVVDEAGADEPFTADNFARFLGQYGPRATDILHAYTRELTESRQKN